MGGLAALPPRGGPWKLESGSGQNSRLIQRRELGGGLKLLGLRKFPLRTRAHLPAPKSLPCSTTSSSRNKGGDARVAGSYGSCESSRWFPVIWAPTPSHIPPCSTTPSSPGQDLKKVSSKEETETGDRVNVLL